MRQAIREILADVARGWAPYGVMPCEAVVEDWGCAGCRRPVVVLTYAEMRQRPGQEDPLQRLFLDECGTVREAERLALAAVEFIDRKYDEFVAIVRERREAARRAAESYAEIF